MTVQPTKLYSMAISSFVTGCITGTLVGQRLLSTSSTRNCVLKVAYWKIRGLAAPLRMICFYSGLEEGVDVEYINYDAGDPTSPDYKASWFSAKEKCKENNAMANLPYIAEYQGKTLNRMVVQTNACLYMLGRKFGLSGKDTIEKSRIDQIVAQTMDWRNDSIGYFYGRKIDNLEEYVNSGLLVHYKKLNDFIESNGTLFSCSNDITLADFHLFEMIDQHQAWFSYLSKNSILKNYPKLETIHNLMRKEKKLELYFNSQYYTEFKLNNPHALFQ